MCGRRFVLCVIAVAIVAMPVSFAFAQDSLSMRTWTHRTSHRQAQARLSHVQGEEIFLKRPDGTLVRTTFADLSDGDREYLDSYSSDEGLDADAEPVATVRGFLQSLRGVPGVVAQLANGDATTERDDEMPGVFGPLLQPLPAEMPANLVHIRLSRPFLEQFIEREVQRELDVHDQILGTSIRGRSKTTGSTELALRPSEDRAVAEVVFTGTVTSRTVGHNGPVRLHSTAQTPFECRKQILFTPDGIRTTSTTSSATTRSRTHRIESTLPGLRGRIAERIAWKRAGEMRGQANAIASQHTEERLGAEFDKSIDRSIATARSVFRTRLAVLPRAQEIMPGDVTYRSTPDYLELVLQNPDVEKLDGDIVPNFNSDADIAVRVHRGVLRSAIANLEIRQRLAPLLVSLLPLQAKTAETQSVSIKENDQPAFHVGWSEDREWLEIDFDRDEIEEAPQNAVVHR